MSDKRLIVFDIVRTLCAIHIIVFWHGVMYFYPNSLFIKFGAPVTTVALACFTFISGLFCRMPNGILAFYKSRIKRLYIPFIFSYFLLIIIGFNNYSLENTLFALTGLSVFLGGQPNTLWFVCMLIIFYAISPLLIYMIKKSPLLSIVIVLASYCLLILPTLDVRILYYFPFYVLGLSLSPQSLAMSIVKKDNIIIIFLSNVLIFCLVVLFLKYCNSNSVMINILTNLLLGISGITILLFISQKLSYINIIQDICNKFAYSSMFAYLFHRVFFFICIYFLAMYVDSIYILIAASIITFICSFWGQKYYDFIIKK